MGVREKKAIAALEEEFNGNAGEQMRSATGNTALKLVFDAGEMEATAIERVGKGIVDDVIPAILEVCKDADYKEEVAKINEITFQVDDGISKPSDFYVNTNLHLEGPKLRVVVNSTSSPSNGTPDVLKQYFESLF